MTDARDIEQRVLDALRWHLAGLRRKVEEDFAGASCESELASLQGDPVYSLFAFDCDEYVLIRMMGRISISIGRRLGEIYDKIPRFLAAARFGLSPEQVAEKFDGLELDVCLRLLQLRTQGDVDHVEEVAKRYLQVDETRNGLGIEIRYNFNPNDSSRLRKDVQLGELIIDEGLTPVYLIFSAISPRAEAIARLRRAGWHFLIGNVASDFVRDLLGMDLQAILSSPRVRDELKTEVAAIMKTMVESDAFRRVVPR